MKKGLSILLEQRPSGQGAGEPSGQQNQGQEEDASQGVSPDAAPEDNSENGETEDTDTSEQEKKKVVVSDDQQLKDDMKALFTVFNFYALTNGKEKRFEVKDDMKDEVTNWIIRNTPSDEELDDRFAEGMIGYMISKGAMPYYITYSRGADNVNGLKNAITVDSLTDSIIGLESIIIESRYISEQMAGTDVVYVFAKAGPTGQIDYQMYSGPYAKNKVDALYTNQEATQTQSQPNASATTDNKKPVDGETQQTSEKRPEEEMGVNPKATMIQKKAEQEGVESIYNNLPKDLQDRLNEYITQGYQTTKPNDQVMDNYDMIDLVQKESSFKDKGFDKFPLWRLKPGIEKEGKTFTQFAKLLEQYTPNKEMCKTTVDMYYASAELDVPHPTDDIRRFANYISRCKSKNFKYFDMKRTAKRINELENNLAERPRYEINYSAGTVGGKPFK